MDVKNISNSSSASEPEFRADTARRLQRTNSAPMPAQISDASGQVRTVAPANSGNPCSGFTNPIFPSKDLLSREIVDIADETKVAGRTGRKRQKKSFPPREIDSTSESTTGTESEHCDYEYSGYGSDYEYICKEEEEETSDGNVFEKKLDGEDVKSKSEVTEATYGDLCMSTARIKSPNRFANNASHPSSSSLGEEKVDETEAANEIYFESSESDYRASDRNNFEDPKVFKQIRTLHNRVERLEEKLYNEVEKLKLKISASK
jgi:hypothetical protein